MSKRDLNETEEPDDVKDKTDSPAYRLFPNPAREQVVVSTNDVFCENCVVYIRDFAGRLVNQMKLPEGKSNFVMDISLLQSGFYSVTVTGGNQIVFNTKLSIIK